MALLLYRQVTLAATIKPPELRRMPTHWMLVPEPLK